MNHLVGTGLLQKWHWYTKNLTVIFFDQKIAVVAHNLHERLQLVCKALPSEMVKMVTMGQDKDEPKACTHALESTQTSILQLKISFGALIFQLIVLLAKLISTLF